MAARRISRARATRRVAGRCGVDGLPVYARPTRRGGIAERWRHVHGCGRFFNCVRDTVTDRIAATYKPGETAAADDRRRSGTRDTAAASIATQPTRAFSFDGTALQRLSPAIRWPRRCWRTAFIWLADRSSIIGRAGSCRRGPRNQTLWSRSIAARAASRRTCARRRSSCTRPAARAARTGFRRCRFDLGAVAGVGGATAVRRFLLQDVHVAARVLAARL